MMRITLKDDSIKEYPHNISLYDIASDISTKLADQCLGGLVDSKPMDMSTKLDRDCKVEFLTADKESGEALEIVRHSTAHLLAQAVKELYPDAKVGIGPVIEDGFYYDFLVEKPFLPADIQRIEERMHEIAQKSFDVERSIAQRGDAMDLFAKSGEVLKTYILQDIPESEEISMYKQGGFIDICKGPHVPNTKFLKHFSITKISASYWRGDSKNQPLQRIYGTAWLKASSLKSYLHRLEEANRRDHRKIGQELDLFHQQVEAHGDVFWHPNGYQLFLTVQNYIRLALGDEYQEIKTPQLIQRKLWEDSGHWEKFMSNMFTLQVEDQDYAIKPMNCPGHVQVFKNAIRSYKDLPIRFSEFGCCHRWEPSGATHGIMRVRSFVQDDAHIFCEFSQIQEETVKFVNLLLQVYKDFGFEEVKIKLATRPQNRAGSDESWDISEKALHDAMSQMGKDTETSPGEGAFYGPKLEFALRDAIGREWQCGTLQVDLVLPVRLGACYINKEGNRTNPVMLHRAILGSFERFIGILIEHYAGKFPFWLAPTQAVICGITNDQDDYVKAIATKLSANGIRNKIDISSGTINYKIRKHVTQKIPYIVVVGQKEMADQTVSVRRQSSKEGIGMSQGNFISELLSQDKPELLRNRP